MAQRIRKGDNVTVLAGRDKGKTGEVVRVIPGDTRAVTGRVVLAVLLVVPGVALIGMGS